MKRLCAWCKKDLDTGEMLSDEEYLEASEDASHSMCPDCYNQAIGLQKEAQKEAEIE